MSPTPHGLHRRLVGLVFATVLVAFSLLPAQPADSVVAVPADSSAGVPLDSLAGATATLEALSAVPDSVKTDSSSRPVKSVLYLGGGENALWFHLGVLYAVEAYSVPVDSVVGTSWGAFIGALWAKGVSPDDIQRILLDSDLKGVVDAEEPAYSDGGTDIPVSESGLPSLRQRFSIYVDSAGNLHRRLKRLTPDTSLIESSLSRLRLQESLLRQGAKFRIPFAVLGCDSAVGNSYEAILASVPVSGDAPSGELCPYLALPAEDSPSEVAIIAVSDPVRGEYRGPAYMRVIRDNVLRNLGTQPGIIVRPHSIGDSSRSGWIQAGFSALESRISQMSALGNRPADYASTRTATVPWFKFKPSYDSLPSETHNPIKSYWDAADTGMTAPRNFAFGLSQFPSCDSVSFNMLRDGDVLVDADIRPTFDVAAGGFGSNAIGPNAFAEISFYYIDQMEIAVSLSGFWGGRSYGFRPALKVDRLWSRDWGLVVGFDWQVLRPLDSFVEELPAYSRINSEERSDISASLYYTFDRYQRVSANFLFADRSYELEPRYYGEEAYNMYPASQKVRYEFVSGDSSFWFSRAGFAAHAELGLTSIGYDFGFDELIPTFITAYADLQYAISPKPFVTFLAGAAFAMDRYHKDGYGYVYPESFEVPALDNAIRPHVRATPWRSEWIDANLSSHQYGLLRMQAALHYHGSGLWLSGAYMHDFEENPTAYLDKHRFVLEPALRIAYKSIDIYAGISRLVDSETLGDLKKFGDYDFFIRVGNYGLF